MSIVTNFVRNLPFKEKIQIFKDYKYFREHGYIGTSLLRERAQEVSKLLNNTSGIVRTMEWVAAEVNEEFAELYLNSNKINWKD